MEYNVHPVVTILGGVAIVGLCFIFRIPVFLLGIISLLLLLYTIVLNKNMFDIEYSQIGFFKGVASLTGTSESSSIASIVLVSTVIILALGYLIHLFGYNIVFSNPGMQQMTPPKIQGWNPFSSGQSTPQRQYRDIDNGRNYSLNRLRSAYSRQL
jgi:hypothetical protein